MDDTNLTEAMAEAIRNNATYLRVVAQNQKGNFAQREADWLSAAILEELADDVIATQSCCADMFLRVRHKKKESK